MAVSSFPAQANIPDSGAARDKPNDRSTTGEPLTGLEAPPPSLDGRYRTSDVTATKQTKFESFNLRRELLYGIYEKGFSVCSPIQEAAIPVALLGKSVVARAKNGTGKTAAYAIPILQRIDMDADHIQAVVLVPARELAMQTSAVFKEFGQFMTIGSGKGENDTGTIQQTTGRKQGVQCMVTTGGTHLKEDILRLGQRVHIIVATLGRLNDLVDRDIAKLKQCRIIVLDEADKLLSSEFCDTCEVILGAMRPEKQILMFSATFPDSVSGFRGANMPGAKEINLMQELTLKGITQYYAYVEERQKLHCLSTLFHKLRLNQVIVFCNAVNRVELLTQKITALGFPCYFIHSKMAQEQRNKVFHDFRTGACRCLVSSDLFTRGIDVIAVNVVINFDFPRNSETYLHRIGRSGRYGHLGLAINLVTEEDKCSLFRVEDELDTVIDPIPEEVDASLYT